MKTPADVLQFLRERLSWLDDATINYNEGISDEDLRETRTSPYKPFTTSADGTLPIRIAISKHLSAIRAIVAGYGLPTRVERLEQCRDIASQSERWTSEIEEILRDEFETLELFLAIKPSEQVVTVDPVPDASTVDPVPEVAASEISDSDYPEELSKSDWAKLLDISVRSLGRRVKDGKLKLAPGTAPEANRVRIHKSDLAEHFLSEKHQKNT